MNPNKINGGETSAPPVEAESSGVAEQANGSFTEKESHNGNPAAQPEKTASTPLSPPVSLPVATPPSLPANDSAVNAPAAGSIPDSDRIDKQWVEKAKSILTATKDDPRQQKAEMSKVKADYIQKRFAKAIKIDETP